MAGLILKVILGVPDPLATVFGLLFPDKKPNLPAHSRQLWTH
jgi:hypothetical protein